MEAEPSQPSRSRGWRVATPLALVACGVLLVSSEEAVGSVFRGTGISDMTDLVRAEQDRAAVLGAEVSQLTAEIDQLTAVGTEGDALDTDRLDSLRAAAGLTPVAGPGVTVTLNDAPIPAEEAREFGMDDYLVHQQDLESVINALWAGGAEAMMVADQRIISTSSVQCIGPVLHLQQRVYAPPYTVTAIGDPDELLAALDESPEVTRYRQYVDLIGLGYTTEVQDDIRMPGYDGPREISAETAA